MTRAAVGIAAAAWCFAAAVVLSGGISFRLAGVPLRSHSPVPAIVIATLFTLVVVASRRETRRAALSWWWEAIEIHSALAAVVVAIAAVAIGLAWGTRVAGGSDSYCYLNQAALFTRGLVHDVEPLAADPAWPGTRAAFVPSGHAAVPSSAGALAPICPAGYSMMLAAASVAAGPRGMFWVTPLMGGLLVWLTFILGRTLGGGASGLLAAVLAGTSPIVIYQIVQPMNDVPAAAVWCAVLAVTSRETLSETRRAILAGLLSGAALTIRPNLLPLAAAAGAWITLRDGRISIHAALAYGAALLPGMAFVLAMQAVVYGSPLRSGYGDLSALFSASHVWPNLERYPRWVVEVHTPILLAALLTPWIVREAARRTALWLFAWCAAVLACYLPYVVFDVWWYQRFLLPALPPLLALTAVPIVRLCSGIPLQWRAPAFFVVCVLFAIVYVQTAARREAFQLPHHEHRFRAAGEFVAGLPANAAIITVHESGSVRYYAGRTTALWDEIPPGRLGAAVDYFRSMGRKPYLLLEHLEDSRFRSRFAEEPLGRLEWPPMAEINGLVRIYDPDDYARYVRGEFIPTEHIIMRR